MTPETLYKKLIRKTPLKLKYTQTRFNHLKTFIQDNYQCILNELYDEYSFEPKINNRNVSLNDLYVAMYDDVYTDMDLDEKQIDELNRDGLNSKYFLTALYYGIAYMGRCSYTMDIYLSQNKSIVDELHVVNKSECVLNVCYSDLEIPTYNNEQKYQCVSDVLDKFIIMNLELYYEIKTETQFHVCQDLLFRRYKSKHFYDYVKFICVFHQTELSKYELSKTI